MYMYTEAFLIRNERECVCVCVLTWEMLTPVSFSTAWGRRTMMSRTSPVSLAAPTSDPPLDTMVIFWAAERGLVISSAILKKERVTYLETALVGNRSCTSRTGQDVIGKMDWPEAVSPAACPPWLPPCTDWKLQPSWPSAQHQRGP